MTSDTEVSVVKKCEGVDLHALYFRSSLGSSVKFNGLLVLGCEKPRESRSIRCRSCLNDLVVALVCLVRRVARAVGRDGYQFLDRDFRLRLGHQLGARVCLASSVGYSGNLR